MNWIKIQSQLTQHGNKLWLLLILVFIVLFAYLLLTRNPLPSDEEFIAQFQAHRADFEELVRRYRHFEPGPDKSHNLWQKQGNTQEILLRAGIRRINYSTPVWFPNPYLLETARKVKELREKSGSIAISHKYGALRIKPAPREQYRAYDIQYVKVWKDLYFFPEVPRIENGEMLGPLDSDGKYSFRSRVFPSLNHYPDNWKRFECVYRPIEPQWFMRMCNGH